MDGSIFIQIFVVGSERRTCFETVRNGPSRSSKVVDLGSNRKRVCHFLLVINSNLGDCRCSGSEERRP